MTDTSMTSDLIERLTQATEGSRELDLDIHKALGWEIAPPEADCSWWNEDGGTFNGSCPNYTTSLDSAVTLVPDGREWSVDGWPTCSSGLGGAAVAGEGNDWQAQSEGSARTPALALCISALRARYRDGE